MSDCCLKSKKLVTSSTVAIDEHQGHALQEWSACAERALTATVSTHCHMHCCPLPFRIETRETRGAAGFTTLQAIEYLLAAEPVLDFRVTTSMTLQYRTRSMWEDRKWLQRIRLCNCLLMDATDCWCRSDADFPTADTVAAFLYLCSSRSDPWALSESTLRSSLDSVVESADREYELAWPARDPTLHLALVDALTEILNSSLEAWESGSMRDPTVESVANQLVDTIVAQQFVVFAHTQTTRRDGGGFHGQG